MKDAIISIGFPVSVFGVIVSWTNIATNQNTLLNNIFFIISSILMFFLWVATLSNTNKG